MYKYVCTHYSYQYQRSATADAAASIEHTAERVLVDRQTRHSHLLLRLLQSLLDHSNAFLHNLLGFLSNA
jgi:hypothetical protein